MTGRPTKRHSVISTAGYQTPPRHLHNHPLNITPSSVQLATKRHPETTEVATPVFTAHISRTIILTTHCSLCESDCILSAYQKVFHSFHMCFAISETISSTKLILFDYKCTSAFTRQFHLPDLFCVNLVKMCASERIVLTKTCFKWNRAQMCTLETINFSSLDLWIWA